LLGLFALGVFLLPAALPDGKYASLYPFDCTLVILGSLCVVLPACDADLPSAGGQGDARGPRLPGWAMTALAFVGIHSYSIYLWHAYFGPPISRRLLEAVAPSLGDSGPATLLRLATYVAVAVALGVVASWIIEKPFLALRERLFPRGGALQATAISAPRT
jgi:peptidoglycan/LPS O-acetylase OafA/YrhL